MPAAPDVRPGSRTLRPRSGPPGYPDQRCAGSLQFHDVGGRGQTRPMARTTYYTAMTLDGFLADEHDSLDWLFVQDQDEQGPLSYDGFIKDIGAIVMGAPPYQWVVHPLAESGEPWPYAMPAWVVTHRELHPLEGADIRFAQGEV